MDNVRKYLYAQINEVFKKYNFSLSRIGRDIDLPEISRKTGTWTDRGLYNKSPRLLIYFKLNNGVLEAGQFANNETIGKLGYINTSKVEQKLGGVFVRITPIFLLPDGQFEVIDQWEWILILILKKPISGGTSSDALSDFFPPSTNIKWTFRKAVRSISFTNASIYGLISPDNQIQIETSKSLISYKEASEALKEYFTFDFTSDVNL